MTNQNRFHLKTHRMRNFVLRSAFVRLGIAVAKRGTFQSEILIALFRGFCFSSARF